MTPAFGASPGMQRVKLPCLQCLPFTLDLLQLLWGFTHIRCDTFFSF